MPLKVHREKITQTGLDITDKWRALSTKYDLPIVTSGIPAFAAFNFVSKNALAYKTLITQEMLKKGYLAGTSVYSCTEHTQSVVNNYFEALDPIFGLVKKCEDGLDVMTLLRGPICHAGFKRLN